MEICVMYLVKPSNHHLKEYRRQMMCYWAGIFEEEVEKLKFKLYACYYWLSVKITWHIINLRKELSNSYQKWNDDSPEMCDPYKALGAFRTQTVEMKNQS
jgi:hypothetical protein